MQTQMDYETDVVLAVFAAPEPAEAAARALVRLGHDVCAVRLARLDAGAYQTEDGSLREGVGGLFRGAIGGAPIGAAVGLGLGWALADAAPAALSGLAGLGVFGGLVLGGFVGGIARSRFDDDEADWLPVPEGDPAVVLVVHTGGDGRRIRGLVRQAGAAGFLDPTTPEADRALAACRTMDVMDARGGDRAGAPRLARWLRRGAGGISPADAVVEPPRAA